MFASARCATRKMQGVTASSGWRGRCCRSVDSLEAGLASAEQASAESLLDGKKATMRLLNSALEQVGIKEVDPHGEPFDPVLHEAMTMAPSEDAEPGTVMEVFQKGYSIHDRLLRAARVVVARGAGGQRRIARRDGPTARRCTLNCANAAPNWKGRETDHVWR